VGLRLTIELVGVERLREGLEGIVGYVCLLSLPIAMLYDFINPAHSGGGPFSYKGGGLLVFLQVWIGFSLFVPTKTTEANKWTLTGK
jgi:hypothetical protein